MATEVSVNDRLLCSGLTSEESKNVEKVLRKNNISYFEKWNSHGGIFHIFDDGKNAKCDLYIHMDSMEKAKEALEDAGIKVSSSKKSK